MMVQNVNFLVSGIGSLSRLTPYFPGKWRVCNWLFYRWLSATRYSQVIALGKNLRVNCNLWDEVQSGIWWNGLNYELKETRYLRQLLEPGVTFFDVGANIGYYSLVAVNDLGNQVQVHAFEPVTQQYRDFCENLSRNGIANVKANRLIISEACGKLTIHLGESCNSGSASICVAYASNTGSETVDSTTLDFYCQQQRVAGADVVKIDVEGHELSVLKGAQEMIARFRPVILVEIRQALLKKAGTSREEIYDWMNRLGYRAYRITPRIDLEPIAKPADGTLIVFKPFE